MAPRTKPKTTSHKRGRRLLGTIHELADGRIAYLANKRQRDIFRMGHSSLVEADAKGEACWGLDTDIIQYARVKGVGFIGVKTKDTGDIYLTRIEAFDPRAGLLTVYLGKGSGGKRFLPLDKFAIRFGKLKL